ncbi:glycosyltransferase [Sulfitobacter sp. 1A12126]|uniref:glycosyltransferase n=1 Tax=Sulfitobacter sp. 1A12126 TaxID=3368591 RepID=UPI0037454659
MKIAIVSSSFDQPSETFVREHISSIAPDDTVLISRSNNSPSGWSFPILTGVGNRASAGILSDFVYRAVNSRWSPIQLPPLDEAENKRVEIFLRTNRVTRVLAEFGPNGYLVLEACKRSAIPLYVHFHGFDATSLPRQRRWRLRYQRLFEHAAGIMVPSNYLAQKLLSYNCPQEKIHVSNNGVDVTRFQPSLHNSGAILAVSRLVPVKGPLITIQAFRIALDKFPNATLDMVGDGPLMQQCKDLVNSLGLAAAVKFHGAQPHEAVVRFMSKAAMFVQHSVEQPDGQTEAFGVSFLEAAAAEVPVIATRSGGIPEVVVHGKTGLLVSEKDVDGMAAAMIQLLTNPVRSVSMGRAARARVLGGYTNLHAANRIREIMTS